MNLSAIKAELDLIEKAGARIAAALGKLPTPGDLSPLRADFEAVAAKLEAAVEAAVGATPAA